MHAYIIYLCTKSKQHTKNLSFISTTMTTTVIKTYRVAPPQGAVVEQSLPLTFFDMMWLHFHPMLQLFFFEFPCSKPHFLESVVPKLQQSLSETLKHFFPFSCNLIHPLSPERMPELRYLSEDSVSFVVAESSDDFDNLVANRADSADRLYSFAPKLPPIVEESDRKIFQVLAAQATLFPGRGVSIGITTHHTVADGMSVVAFMETWASINKHDGYGDENEVEFPCIFDRSVVKYPTKLDSIYWERAQRIPLETRYPSLPTNRMRATYVFSAPEIKKLKDSVQARISDSIRLSSFVAIAAYIWTGMAKSLRTAEVDDDEHELTHFIIPMDLRSRLDPPVPVNYFGNCISYALATIRRGDLVGGEGLFLAAEAMAEGIKKRINNEKILDCTEVWSPEIVDGVKKSYFSMVGSSRLDLYGVDFGWGKARKQEILSNDVQKYAMTLCKSRDFEGGVEVCMSLPKEEMEVFGAYISQGIIKAS